MTSVIGNLLVAWVRVVFVLAMILHLFLSIAAIHNNLGILFLTIRNTPTAITHTLSLIIGSVAPVASALILAVLLRDSRGKSALIHALAILVTLSYVGSSILLSYRLNTGLAADPFILWYHFRDALRTVMVLSTGHVVLSAAIVMAVLCFYRALVDLLRCAERQPRGVVMAKAGRARLGAIILLAALTATQFYAENGAWSLLLEFREPRSEARTLYIHFFEDSVARNTRQKLPIGRTTNDQNLFFIHLESLNAQLVNSAITPKLVETAGRNGIWFPKIQGASVFTILAMESILCSVLPTLAENLAQSNSLFDRLVCLPRIMNQMGYRTFYFQNFANLDFNNMGPFLRAIGFDEQHSGDLIKPGDKLLSWGLPEELFYERVFAHLDKFKNERVFAYILVGATNHYPFYGREIELAYPHLLNQLPYQHPLNIRERLANTTFIQDQSFGQMYEKLFSRTYADNSHMFVFGDHSWPIEIHQGNNHNLNGAFQENFVSALAILPARKTGASPPYAIGKEVKSLYSQIDILPTVLEMYGMRAHNFYGGSLYSEITGQGMSRDRGSCIVSAQPFSGGAIALIDYPLKYIFDLKKGAVTSYHLEQDPNELKPLDVTRVGSTQMAILNRCLMSIRDKRPMMPTR